MTVELESWRRACIVLVVVSMIIGLVQRSGYQFLDVKFEVAIFHIPAMVSLLIYYSLSKRAAK